MQQHGHRLNMTLTRKQYRKLEDWLERANNSVAHYDLTTRPRKEIAEEATHAMGFPVSISNIETAGHTMGIQTGFQRAGADGTTSVGKSNLTHRVAKLEARLDHLIALLEKHGYSHGGDEAEAAGNNGADTFVI